MVKKLLPCLGYGRQCWIPKVYQCHSQVTLEHGTLSDSEPEGAVYPDSKPGDSNDCTFEVIFN